MTPSPQNPLDDLPDDRLAAALHLLRMTRRGTWHVSATPTYAAAVADLERAGLVAAEPWPGGGGFNVRRKRQNQTT